MSETPQRATFVVNPHAAGGRTGKQWTRLEPMMRQGFPTAEIQFTQRVGDGIRIAAEAIDRGQELLVAVGGDGTLHEVINGMMAVEETRRERAVLGIWPAGSGSDFARGMRIPTDPDLFLELLSQGSPRRIDLGAVRCQDADDKPTRRYFLNAADFGIGAKVVERLQKRSRWLPGRSSYLWQTIRTLITYRNPTANLAIDEAPAFERTFKSIVIANAPYFGGGMCIAPDARTDDGLLNLVQVGDLGRIEAIRRLGETFQGGRIDHPDLHYSTCISLHASSASHVPIEADGELVGFLPATFEIVPSAIQALLPS